MLALFKGMKTLFPKSFQKGWAPLKCSQHVFEFQRVHQGSIAKKQNLLKKKNPYKG